MLWDPRCAAAVAAVSAPSGSWVRGPDRPSCSAVQLDDWKLVAAFNQDSSTDTLQGSGGGGLGATTSTASRGVGSGGGGGGGGSGVVAVFDMRAVPSISSSAGLGPRRCSWGQPLRTLQAPGRVNCIKVWTA